ncbi:MAG: cyanophycin synthetase [Rhizobiales bacterium]|nr:cyanophycin synthetase [Hyphomicrobiales bacterium]
MTFSPQIKRTAFRSLRLLDVSAEMARLRFAALRRDYYDLFWINAAEQVGATCEKWGFGCHRISRGGLTAIVRLSDVRLDDHLTLDLMGNKLLTYRLLAEQGFAIPRHARFSFSDLGPALSLIGTTGRPIVVKPVSGTGGGNGVTTGVTSRPGLIKAAWLASRFDPDLIAEEQIEGHSYRLLFLDGVLLDAVRRDPPRLVGDGKNTIGALVRAENRKRLSQRPFEALSPLWLDRDALNYLAAQGLTPRSRPVAGETIIVKRAVNQNAASDNHAVTHLVYPATVTSCARLVNNLGVRFAGIDILARDIARPLVRENGLIGEINTTPGLHHHDLVAGRCRGQPVAAELLEHLFQTRSGIVITSQQSNHPLQLRKVAG